jgi:DNA-binding beta-propeller fold protein YncE
MQKALLLVMSIAAVGCGNLGDVNPSLAVRYSPDGTLVVFAGDVIDLYDEELTTRLARIPAHPDDGRFASVSIYSLSADGTVAAALEYDMDANRSRLQLFSIPGRTRLPAVDLQPPPDKPEEYVPEDFALSPHGDLVYLVGGVASDYRKTGMIDIASGTMLWSNEWAIAPVFSPDGSQIYVSGEQGQAVLGFDARSGAPVLNAPIAWADGLGWTTDPDTLIGLFDRTIQLISIIDGSVVGQFEAVSATEQLYGALPLGMPAFRCSAQAGLCAVGVGELSGVMASETPGGRPQPIYGGPARVKVWSQTGVLYQFLRLPEGVGANDVAISPDGQYVATGDASGHVAVFRIDDGSLVNGHQYGGSVF